MPLSRRHLDTNTRPVTFDCDVLGRSLEQVLPAVVFAYLHGSSAETCTVRPHTDIDIALFLSSEFVHENGHPAVSDAITAVEGVADTYVPGVRADIGILNDTEPVFRFEVLKGRLLFCRDRETWLRFYSLTCREYESQLFHYEKQHRYRLEAAT